MASTHKQLGREFAIDVSLWMLSPPVLPLRRLSVLGMPLEASVNGTSYAVASSAGGLEGLRPSKIPLTGHPTRRRLSADCWPCSCRTTPGRVTRRLRLCLPELIAPTWLTRPITACSALGE